IEAFVVATPGAKLTEATLADHCATGLVKYKHPARIHLVEALPLTPVRKIDKVALRALALAGRVADVA
ncbi:p-hydroxycinnamoyl-CoA synthetase, partial [Acinetobacter baumannii]